MAAPAPAPAPALARRRHRLVVAILELGVAVGTAVLLLGVLPELARIFPGGSSNGLPGSDTARATPSFPGTRAPAMVVMSPDADCAACHQTANGDFKTPIIPVIAHPVEGWGDCTACHANDRLVKTAPGHSGLHKNDCLVCHKAPAPGGSPPPRPHHVVTDKACISCHGSVAPLPTDMAGRQNCWLCHAGTEFSALFGSPAPTSSPSSP